MFLNQFLYNGLPFDIISLHENSGKEKCKMIRWIYGIKTIIQKYISLGCILEQKKKRNKKNNVVALWEI